MGERDCALMTQCGQALFRHFERSRGIREIGGRGDEVQNGILADTQTSQTVLRDARTFFAGGSRVTDS